MKLLIKNGEIVDGTGIKPFISDILVSDGIIVEIAENITIANENVEYRIIDAKGLVVAPGFIDMHSHSDATFTCETRNEEKLQQGVTTQVNGNCGFGLFPMVDSIDFKEEVVKDLSSVEFYIKSEDIKWVNFKEFAKHFEENTFGTNHLSLVPHSLIRTSVVGFGDKKVEKFQIKKMQDLLREQLDFGAWGMSTGLAYAPGCFSTKEELLALCEILKEKDKIYFSHIRDEGDGIIESVNEVIELAEETGVKVHISHLKTIGVKNHYKTSGVIELINSARCRGLRVTADLYPYEASSTMLSILLPKEASVGSIDKLIQKLSDSNYKTIIQSEVEYNLNNRGGSEKIIINFVNNEKFNFIVGKTLKEISNIYGMSDFETIVKLIVENNNIVNGIFFAISKDGIEELLSEDFTSVGSDGMINLEQPNTSHPRTYGTFPRVFAEYVRNKGTISLENAVYKLTKLPAKIMNLHSRGELKVGNVGDITIFDKDTIKDTSTFEKAFSYPVGISYVIVNGEVIIENSKFIGNLQGKILKKY